VSISDIINSNKTLRTENEKLKIRRRTLSLSLSIAGIVVYPLVNMWLAFWVMLGLGAAHDQWPVIPALGFWTTYLIMTGVGTVSGFIHHGNRFAVKEDKEI
jgi:hypothetical protein